MTQSRHHQFFHRAQVSCCLCLTYSVHSTTGLWSLLQFPSIHLFCFIIYVYFTNGICHSAHQSQCLWSSSRLTSTNSVSLWSALEKPPVDRTYSKSRRGHWVTLSFCSCVDCSPSLRSFTLFSPSPSSLLLFCLRFLTLYAHTTDIFAHASPTSQEIMFMLDDSAGPKPMFRANVGISVFLLCSEAESKECIVSECHAGN